MGTNWGCIPLFQKYPKLWQGSGNLYTMSGIVVTVIHVQKACPHHQSSKLEYNKIHNWAYTWGIGLIFGIDCIVLNSLET